MQTKDHPLYVRLLLFSYVMFRSKGTTEICHRKIIVFKHMMFGSCVCVN